MALSPADRVRLGLDEPYDNGTGQPVEFPPSLAAPVPSERRPNVRLMLKEGEKASAPKIRQMVNELLAGNIDNADFALKQLFAANPKLGLEAFIELAKFSLPQLKAVAVQVDDRSDNPRALTFQQLQQALTQD